MTTRLAAYRGTLQPLHVVNGHTLSRSLSNGNYYFTTSAREPSMVSVQDAAAWVQKHGLEPEHDMRVWLKEK